MCVDTMYVHGHCNRCTCTCTCICWISQPTCMKIGNGELISTYNPGHGLWVHTCTCSLPRICPVWSLQHIVHVHTFFLHCTHVHARSYMYMSPPVCCLLSTRYVPGPTPGAVLWAGCVSSLSPRPYISQLDTYISFMSTILYCRHQHSFFRVHLH